MKYPAVTHQPAIFLLSAAIISSLECWRITMAFKHRRDGIYLGNLHPFRKIFPYLMLTRTESVVYFSEKIDMTKVLVYLSRKNEGRDKNERITIFHVFLATVSRILKLRPELNRFIVGRRIYEHKDISLTFIIKKELTEEAPETNAHMVFDGTETLIQARDMLARHLAKARGADKGDDDMLLDFVAALPRPAINFVSRLIRFLDYHNILPAFLMNAIPLYTSVFLANLGSIGLDAPFHHLFEFGNASIFLVIGRLHKAPVVNEQGEIVARDCINISVTLDERITEGFYGARTILLFKKLMENPELLDNPDCSVESIFEYCNTR
jgi:hypothetical protein